MMRSLTALCVTWLALAFTSVTPTYAHIANISAAIIVPEADGTVRVEIGMLLSDLTEIAGKSTISQHPARGPSAEANLLALGNIIGERIILKNESGQECPSRILSVLADPDDPNDVQIKFVYDCTRVMGTLSYNAAKLFSVQSIIAKHHAILADAKGETLQQAILSRGEPALTLAAMDADPWRIIGPYFVAGIDHIVSGFDHMCFLIAVVLWATRIWPVIKIVTAFTLSHSVTLTLAALGIVHVPGAWVEVAIAISIIYVALENFVSRSVDRRWKDTFCFGFVHGLGFAGGLVELGLPRNAVVPALASFNLGIEVGQITVILIALMILSTIDRFMTHGTRSTKIVYTLSTAIACGGVYWTLTALKAIWH